ncbi:hypothetical protein ABTE85_23370, partial [Acinetobacter baumannii]
IEATAPFPRLVLRVLNAWARRALRPALLRAGDVRRIPRSSQDSAEMRRDSGDSATFAREAPDGWAYLRRLARLSAAVTA